MIYANKYDVFSVATLLKHVQETVPRLKDPKSKKEMGQARHARARTELNQMRNALIDKLSKMDRYDPKFFPKGCRVLYLPPSPNFDIFDFSAPSGPQEPEKHGTVIEHDYNKVLVQFDGQTHFVRVEPERLKLLFVRDYI